ncbi:MAG TPA: hypothetical protein EYH09_02315 [Candidatus Nanopusillus sp.]|nr:hypothetical protein [Candidatus Nanopusillus sp.]
MKYIDLPNDLKKSEDLNDYSNNVEAVENSLRNIISTQKGSIPGHPEFGCKTNNFIFRLMNPLVLVLLEEEIRYALTRWETRITIKSIKAYEDLDYNRLVLHLSYTIKADVKGRVYDFIYKKH